MMLYNVNLLDWRERRRCRLNQHILLVSLLGVIGFISAQWWFASDLEFKRIEVTTQISVITESNQALLSAIKHLKKESSGEKTNNNEYSQWSRLSKARMALLESIYRVIPATVYLQRIEQKKHRIAFSGEFLDASEFQHFIELLRREPMVVSIEIKGIALSTERGGLPQHHFQVACQLTSNPEMSR